MSCNCDNSQGPCCEEPPYPIVSEESVPSLVSNLAYALYGVVTKSVVNGSIIWNTPCDPNLSAQITGLPRNPGEGLLCYFLRCFNLIVSGSFLVQPGSIAPSQLTTGHPTWDASGNLTILGNLALSGTANIANITGNAATATLAAGATNLAGGTGGALPYQSAAGVTSFLAPGTSGYVLASGGAGAPAWKQTATAATANTMAIRDGSGGLTASQFHGPLTGNVTGNLTGNVTGNVTGNLTGRVVGATTAAASGILGEIITVTQTVNFPTGVSYSGLDKFINAVSVTAGTWDISSVVQISGTNFGTVASTVWQSMMGNIATVDAYGRFYSATPTIVASGATTNLTLMTPPIRFVGGPFNTIESNVNLTFTGASAAISVTSTIYARRVA